MNTLRKKPQKIPKLTNQNSKNPNTRRYQLKDQINNALPKQGKKRYCDNFSVSLTLSRTDFKH